MEFELSLMQRAFEGMFVSNHYYGPNTKAIMRTSMNSKPVYRSDATNYQAAMDQFINIIKHIGSHIHVFKVDTGDGKEYAKYNFYTMEISDGLSLKPLSCILVETILAACPILQKLTIWKTRFLDCSENGLCKIANFE